MNLTDIRADIAQRRERIARQRKEIQARARDGISTRDAEDLLQRMLDKVDELAVERDRLAAQERRYYPGPTRFIRGADGHR